MYIDRKKNRNKDERSYRLSKNLTIKTEYKSQMKNIRYKDKIEDILIHTKDNERHSVGRTKKCKEVDRQKKDIATDR